MAELPQHLTRARNVEARETYELAARRGFFTLVALLCVLALANVFGQRPTTSRAAASGAELEVYAPAAVRGGLYFQGRFTIRARADIRKATLVLDPGWMESMHINTIEPSPIGEASRDGDLVLELGRVPAGQKHVLYMQFQVNPTNVGRRPQTVSLYDGDTLLAQTKRTVMVVP